MWSSIVHRPTHLARAMVGGRVWRRPLPLAPGKRSLVEIEPGTRLPTPASSPTVAS